MRTIAFRRHRWRRHVAVTGRIGDRRLGNGRNDACRVNAARMRRRHGRADDKRKDADRKNGLEKRETFTGTSGESVGDS